MISGVLLDKCLASSERRKRTKARGQKVDEDDDAPSGDESAAEQDPFFKHEDTAFDDPFFKVKLSPGTSYYTSQEATWSSGGFLFISSF